MSLHPSVESRLARLSPDQRAAATAPRGPTLCVAPAGSGKTTTLVARIAWLVDGGVAPATISAVTFNKRAADELASRVGEALGPLGVAPSIVRVRTFHAMGREILADSGVDVSRLADRETILHELLGPRIPTALLRRLDAAFSRQKLDPDDRPMPADIGAVFARYQGRLADQGSIDFDDLVCRALQKLREDAALLSRWRQACASLLVDEVQDLDRSQLELALLLAGRSADVFLVGDDDQTIYAWRLADVRRVLTLAARLPGLRRHDLVTNRRCPPEVVRRASRLVACNTERFAKRIEASASATGVVRLAADPADDVARARRLLGGPFMGGSGSHAVLSRTNAELAPYAAVAIEQGISYRVADDGLVLEDPAIDAVLDGAGRSAGLPLLALQQALATTRPAPQRRLASSLLAWAAPFGDIVAFRAAIEKARRSRAGLRRDDAELILATAHATKGLEFDHVACIGLDEGTFPSGRSLADAADPVRTLEEERRLAYVAWTRARRSLTLVYDPAAPSRFLCEAFDAYELRPLSHEAERQRGPAPDRPRTRRRSTEKSS